MDSELDMRSPPSQMLDLGGQAIRSLRGKNAAELGRKLHSVCPRIVIRGHGTHLESKCST